jgi:hypothetical protein
MSVRPQIELQCGAELWLGGRVKMQNTAGARMHAVGQAGPVLTSSFGHVNGITSP